MRWRFEWNRRRCADGSEFEAHWRCAGHESQCNGRRWRDADRRGRRSPGRTADRSVRARALGSTTAIVVGMASVVIATAVAVHGASVVRRRRGAGHASMESTSLPKKQQSDHQQSADSALLSRESTPGENHWRIIGASGLRVKAAGTRVSCRVRVSPTKRQTRSFIARASGRLRSECRAPAPRPVQRPRSEGTRSEAPLPSCADEWRQLLSRRGAEP